MEKYTLIPSSFFDSDKARAVLAQVVDLKESDIIKHIELPQYKAVLVYATTAENEDATPSILGLLQASLQISEHNRTVIEFAGDMVHLVLANPDKLLLANSYPASEFVTAEYFLFAALKEFSLNPEVTTLYYNGTLSYEEKESLFNYFQGVESISSLQK